VLYTTISEVKSDQICNMQDGMMNPVETVFNAIDRLGEL